MTTYVGSATGTTSATLPTHQAGDIIFGWAFRDGNTTAPTLPAGWTAIANSGANTCSGRIAYKIALSGAETSGTWTNATSVVFMVYRPAANKQLRVGGNGTSSGSSTTVTYNTVTMTNATGSSWVSGFAGHRSVNTSLQTPPTGMVNRATVVDATDEAAGHDTNGGVTSWTSTNVSVGGTASGWISYTVEITEAPAGSWSATDKGAGIVLSNNNLTAGISTTLGADQTGRGTTSYSTGKYYFEITRTIEGGGAETGFANASASTATWLSNSANGLTVNDSGSVYTNNVLVATVASSTTGDTLRFYLDLTNRTFWVTVNGGLPNNSGTANPDTNTGGISFSGLTGAVFPALSVITAPASYTLNPSPTSGNTYTTFSPWAVTVGGGRFTGYVFW